MRRTLLMTLTWGVGILVGHSQMAHAQTTCEPFSATTVVSVGPTGTPGEFALAGDGDSTLGPIEQIGLIQFKLVGDAVHFRSLTVISTANGLIYTAEAGNATEEGTVGSFRILGGTGAWEGASGSGAFRVDPNPDGTQKARYIGVICR
jgi:hypothetical protein